MALGNSSGASSARQKGQIIKGIKERKTAAGYTAFNCGPTTVNHSTACAGNNTGNTFYHNGASAIPVVDNIVYKEQRARVPNSFAAGFYKVAAGGKGSVSLQINSSGVCIARTNC